MPVMFAFAGKSSAHEAFRMNKDDCLRLNSCHFQRAAIGRI